MPIRPEAARDIAHRILSGYAINGLCTPLIIDMAATLIITGVALDEQIVSRDILASIDPAQMQPERLKQFSDDEIGWKE